MRTPEHLNQYRNRKHPLFGSDDSLGMNGLFVIPMSKSLHKVERWAVCMVSDGTGEATKDIVPWEHVSLRIEQRHGTSVSSHTPTWEEMCAIKDLFWREDEVVMQLHPAKANYVNVHQNVLHLWRPRNQEIPLPPLIAV
jgi:hypothetical protein